MTHTTFVLSQHLKETTNINKSLFTLGKVISGLSKGLVQGELGEVLSVCVCVCVDEVLSVNVCVVGWVYVLVRG